MTIYAKAVLASADTTRSKSVHIFKELIVEKRDLQSCYKGMVETQDRHDMHSTALSLSVMSNPLRPHGLAWCDKCLILITAFFPIDFGNSYKLHLYLMLSVQLHISSLFVFPDLGESPEASGIPSSYN